MNTYDVALIGYGPIGAIAANVLGMYGISTAVIEHEKTPYDLPRAIVIDDEIMRVFQQVGLIDEILPLTKVIAGEQFLNSKRRILFTADLASHHNGYAPTNTFYQPQLEAVLRRGVARFPSVEVYLGHEVTAIAQDETGVTLTIAAMPPRPPLPIVQHDADTVQATSIAQEQQLRARYVLGCDGAKSITRTSAAIRLRNLKSHQAWLVVDALLKDEENALQSSFVQQYCNPIRPETYVPSVQRHRRWEFMLAEGEQKEEITRPERVQALLSSWIDPTKLEIVRATVYTFHALIAEQWSNGRLFLLGDAAHQMPPFLGQGMCTGIRDAANLCWKLALVLKGQAAPVILASYQQEREPHARAVIGTAVNFGRIIQARQPLAWLRDRMLPLLAYLPHAFSLSMPPLLSGLFMHTSPHKHNAHKRARASLRSVILRRTHRHTQGMLIPQPRVHTTSGEEVLLDELLGLHFAIVGLNVNPRTCLDPSMLPFWDSLPTRFVQVTTSNSRDDQSGTPNTQTDLVIQIIDSESQLANWFARYRNTIAIVRPDRYVFGLCTPQTLSNATQRLQALLN